MDWAGRTEDRGNIGETADSFFHPLGPSKFGYLIQRKNLILQPNLTRGADRTPFHPMNPGSGVVARPHEAASRSGVYYEVVQTLTVFIAVSASVFVL